MTRLQKEKARKLHLAGEPAERIALLMSVPLAAVIEFLATLTVIRAGVAATPKIPPVKGRAVPRAVLSGTGAFKARVKPEGGKMLKITVTAPKLVLDLKKPLGPQSLRAWIRRFVPVDSGALSDSIKVRKTGDLNFQISSEKKYAAIQNFGGFVPPYHCPKGKVMRFRAGGDWVFTKKRKGFHLKGYHYVEQGIRAWLNKLKFEWKRTEGPGVGGASHR